VEPAAFSCRRDQRQCGSKNSLVPSANDCTAASVSLATRPEFRTKAPGNRKFNKPQNIVLRKTAKSKRWLLALVLDRSGDWIVKIHALDASRNASRWQDVTIKRG